VTTAPGRPNVGSICMKPKKEGKPPCTTWVSVARWIVSQVTLSVSSLIDTLLIQYW
jgi:hypothetical protein